MRLVRPPAGALGHVTIGLLTCGFLLVTAFLALFSDVKLQRYRGHNLDLLGHVTSSLM